MTKNILLVIALSMLAGQPAFAQLQGADTKPGDACSASEGGYTRRNASEDQDKTEITLICNGSQWVSANDVPSSVWLNDGPGGASKIYYNGGNVGIGTNNPATPLELVSNDAPVASMTGINALKPNMAAGDIFRINVGKENESGNRGGIGFRYTGDNDALNQLVFSIHSYDNLMVIQRDGNVGIGTVEPLARLDVNGSVKIGDGAELCNVADHQGAIRYVVSTDAFEMCRNSAMGWEAIGAGGGDAPTLDGLDSAQFLRSDVADTATGQITFNQPLIVNNTFAINGMDASGQQNGLYVADLGGTQGTTLNPTYTAAIVGQINASRSIALSVDTSGYLYGFRSHSNPGTYTFSSKTKSADDADLLDGQDSVFYRNASNLNAGTVATARLGSGTANTTTYLRGDGSWQAVPSGADNLGNHTATQTLDLSTYSLTKSFTGGAAGTQWTMVGNDGNGNLNEYINSTTGTSPTYQTAGPAYRWLYNGGASGSYTLQYAPVGAAGGAIAWSTVFAANNDGTVGFGGKRVVNVANPTTAGDAATKSYVDSAVSGAGDNLGNHTATANLTMGTNSVVFGNTTGDKALWYSNTYGTGIESSTLTHWSGANHRWRIGGTSVSTGTERMLLNNSGLTVAGGIESSTGEVVANLVGGSGQFRAIGGNYGSFIRNDGTNTYWLLTNSGDQNGAWNSLRPLTINNASGAVSMANGLSVTGTVSGTTFSGSGASLTALPAANLTGILPAISGANLTNLNASNLSSGTVAAARMPALTGDVTTTAGNTATNISANAVGTNEIANNSVAAVDTNFVGTLTEGKWCTVSGGKIVCTSDAPSGGSGSGPSGCVLEGQFCDDGTILAGVIGNEVLYVTDQNQSTSIQWATLNQSNSGAQSMSDGQANQAWIVANRTLSQYPAFQLCENLNRHGHTDWYLPSRHELNVMYGNKDAIGGFTTSDYWSSTEDGNGAWRQAFNSGSQSVNYKTANSDVRCVRRG